MQQAARRTPRRAEPIARFFQSRRRFYPYPRGVKKEHFEPLVRRGRQRASLVASPEKHVMKLLDPPFTTPFREPIDAKALARGLKKTAPKLKKAAALAVERVRTKKLDEVPTDAVAEACFAAMIGLRRATRVQCEALASIWARASGAFAVEVAVQSLFLELETFDAPKVVPLPVTYLYPSRFVSMSGDPMHLEAMRGLRLVLAAIDDDAYDAAKAVAAKHRKGLDPAHRSMLSFAFATEHAWLEEDAAEAFAQPALPRWATPLLATELDRKTATRLAAALPDEHYVVQYLATAADIHGAGVKGILKPLVATKARSKDDRRALVAVMDGTFRD